MKNECRLKTFYENRAHFMGYATWKDGHLCELVELIKKLPPEELAALGLSNAITTEIHTST